MMVGDLVSKALDARSGSGMIPTSRDRLWRARPALPFWMRSLSRDDARGVSGGAILAVSAVAIIRGRWVEKPACFFAGRGDDTILHAYAAQKHATRHQ